MTLAITKYKIPDQYSWLLKEPAPKMLIEALALYGITETPGKANTQEIIGWAKEVGLSDDYNSDEIPWCGLFIAVIAFRAGKKLPSYPLWALDWRNWGTRSDVPMLGDVLCFKRNGGGHVGIYVGEDNTHYHVFGGNQNNRVGIVRIAKTRFVEARRMYKIGPPPNVRQIFLKPTGTISEDES